MPDINLAHLKTSAQKSAEALARAKAEAQDELRQTLDGWLNAWVTAYPEVERLSWADQKDAALKIQLLMPLNSVEQALVDNARVHTAETEAEWAARVLAKAAPFSVAAGAAAGLRTSFRDQIDAATDQTGLDLVVTAMRSAISLL